MVVTNQVEVGFRTNEEIAVNVVTDTAPKVTHEMIAADEVGTSEAAGDKSLVEADAFPTDAGHEFGSRVFAKFRGVDSVNVVKKWPFGLDIRVDVAAGPPGEFAAHPKLAL